MFVVPVPFRLAVRVKLSWGSLSQGHGSFPEQGGPNIYPNML